ncbi:MAG: acetylornithine deacetylase/succinyl-diaminopimelate desuccinylase family protein [Acidobacteriota bacterium]
MLLAVLLGGMLAAPAVAQVDGAIVGTVRDPSGAALAGVTATVRGAALQRDRLTVTTTADGGYRLFPIPAGVYELDFELDGFRKARVEALRVAINQTVTVDATLELATVEETVLVTSDTPLIEITRTELSTNISPESIENLPLNGRNFEDLVSLVPGVKPDPANVRDQQFSIFGERPAATSFVVDGGDNNDPLDGGAFQRYTQDSIQEFQVLTTGYEAEFGKAQGGVVNVITRSGTNELKGSAFYFVRDDSLDSSNVDGQDVPRLERDQWGASLGGPIQRDRTFFFASAELIDEARGRNIDRSRIPQFVQDGLATPQGVEDFNLGPELEGLSLLGKIDLLPNTRNRWTLSFNLTEDDATGETPIAVAGSLVLPSGSRTQDQESTSVTLRQTWLSGSDGFLESTLRVSDGSTGNNLDQTERQEAILLLFLGNFLQTGASFGGRSERNIERLQLAQSYTWLRDDWHGDHEFKVGYDYVDTTLDGFDEVFNDVEYSAAFFSPDVIPITEDLFRRFGFAQSAARFFTLPNTPGGDLLLDISNEDVGLFVQDKWRVNDRLSIDLGLRYDVASLFDDDDDNFAPRFGFAWDVGGRRETLVRGSAGLFFDRNALVAAATVPEKGGIFTRAAFDVVLPRLGVDYTDSLIDLVITTGLFGGPPENPLYALVAADLRANPFHLYELLGIAVGDPSLPPVVTADNIQQLAGMTAEQALALLEATYPGTDWEFFDVPGGSIVGDRVLSFFPRGPLDQSRTVSVFSEDRTPKTEAFTLGIEHRLSANWTASLDYVHRRTEDLLTRRIVNLFDVPPGDPNFAQTTDGGPRISAVTYDGFIDYDGFVLSVRRPFSGRYGLTASYTYSDSTDNLLTGDVGSTFSNNNRPEIDIGESNLSAPHVGVIIATTLLPWDIRFSGSLFWRSGNAFSPRGIVDTDGDGLVDQRDVSVPRNDFRVANFFNVDLRLEKSFRLGGDHEISLLVDAFNVTNEDNVSNVNAVQGPDFGVPNSFFPGREIQIGARFFLGGRLGGGMIDSVLNQVEALRDEMVAFAADLIRIPTVNPPGDQYPECARFIGQHLADFGYAIEYIAAEGRPEHTEQHPRLNVIGTRTGSETQPVVHLNGHFDVVPVGAGWTVDPFGGEVKDGRLYGRGSADMKAGLASAIYAAEAIRRAGVELGGTVEISGTVDEESGGFAGVAYLAEIGRISSGRTDHVIIPEPLDVDRICLGHRGVYWFKVISHGHIGHGSMPFLGVNAIEQMGPLLEALRTRLGPALEETHTAMPVEPPAARRGTLNINSIQGGQAGEEIQTPCVADRCEAIFDRRFLVEEGYDATRRQIVELLDEVAGEDDRRRYQLEDLMVVHPTLTPEDDPLVRSLARSIERVCQRPPQMIASPGTYDHKHVARIADVPSCVAYGPGRLEQAHQPDEWCCVDDMVDAAKVIALTLLDLLPPA